MVAKIIYGVIIVIALLGIATLTIWWIKFGRDLALKLGCKKSTFYWK